MLAVGSSLNATQAERYSSIAELTSAADAVVRGSVVSVRPGRTFGNPAAPFSYAAATIRIGGVLAGGVRWEERGALTLELPLFDGPESVGAVASELTGAEGVFFLRSKGASARAAGMSSAQQRAEAGYYRLVTFGAMAWDDDGCTLAASVASSAT